MIGINTRYTTQLLTGVQRFASAVEAELSATPGVTVCALSLPENGMAARADELISLSRRASAAGCDATLSMCNWSPILHTSSSVVVIHDVLEQQYPEYYSTQYRLLRRGYLAALRRSRTHVVTVSERSCTALESWLDRPVDVVPAGVTLPTDERIAELRWGAAPVANRSPYLLFVGAHDARKNLTFLEGLVPWLRRNGVTLVVTMRVGSPILTGALPDWVSEAADVVEVICDPDDDALAALYANASAVVQPSRAEGFGLPILEAAAHATPFVSSAVGIAEQLAVADKQVATLDIDAWCESLDWLLAQDRDALAVAHRQQASQYSWADTARALAEICALAAGRYLPTPDAEAA
ncbi:glycosyltransferase [Gordonia sp. VNK1]|uniref:glycosyltransferase n=1 Tax=Gordonia oleivorans TaxID=3156618 RepID=UPI0032B347C2